MMPLIAAGRWHWLDEELEQHLPAERLTLANPFKTRIPGMGPILASVVVSEIDDIGRFSSAQKLCGYIGLCPSTSSSGGKTHNGKLMKHCNKWLRWAFVDAAWVAIGCDSYLGDLYKKKRALGKKANSAILCVARRMARITWQLLMQGRDYQKKPPAPPTKAKAAQAKTKQTLTPLRYALRAARSSLSVSLRSAPQPL